MLVSKSDQTVSAPLARTHFMVLPGVICPNSDVLLRIATYGASVSSGLSVAEPK